MRITSTRISDGTVLVGDGRREYAIPDGTYRRDDGTWINVSEGRIDEALLIPDVDIDSNDELRGALDDLRTTAAELVVDQRLSLQQMQTSLREQTQMLQLLSNLNQQQAAICARITSQAKG